MTGAWTAGRTVPDARLRDLPQDPGSLPALPRAFNDTLDAGLVALGITLPPDARAAIDAHVRLLLGWNGAINLTAVTDPGEIATRHVLDSLTPIALELLPGAPAPRNAAIELVDLGSGGGFPGLPLAAALPSFHVAVVDSVGKKARFLEVAVLGMNLGDRAMVRAARAEELAAASERWDVVTARAVGSLADLVELALPLLRTGGRLIAWKRGDIAAELEAGRRAARALGAGEPRAYAVTGVAGLDGHLLDGHLLVTVDKLRPTPGGYPRDPARRSRHPW